MDETVVHVERLDLKPDRELLSPPWLAEPLYQCATAVTVLGLRRAREGRGRARRHGRRRGHRRLPGARGRDAAAADPARRRAEGARAPGVGRDRRATGRPSWRCATTRSTTPPGPPRPQINPAPPLTCGARTGVNNLLGGANVWITADGTEVGRVNGCATPQQGVNINPFYTFGQKVRAWTELCGDKAPPSIEHTVQPGPSPLPVPGFDPIYAGGEQLRITGIANGARVSVSRGATPLGTYRCWGGVAAHRALAACSARGRRSPRRSSCAPATRRAARGRAPSCDCSSLPAPTVGPVQAGDTWVTITSSAPGATIRVFRNLVQVGHGQRTGRPPDQRARRGRHGPRAPVAARAAPASWPPQLHRRLHRPAVLRRPVGARPVPRRPHRVRRRRRPGQRLLPRGRRRAGPAVQRAAGQDGPRPDRRHGARQPLAGRPQLPRVRLLPAQPGQDGDDRGLGGLQRAERCGRWRRQHRGPGRPDHRLHQALPDPRRDAGHPVLRADRLRPAGPHGPLARRRRRRHRPDGHRLDRGDDPRGARARAHQLPVLVRDVDHRAGRLRVLDDPAGVRRRRRRQQRRPVLRHLDARPVHVAGVRPRHQPQLLQPAVGLRRRRHPGAVARLARAHPGRLRLGAVPGHPAR